MNEEQIKTLKNVLSTILDITDNEVEFVRKINNRKWDSLAQVSIVSAIESEFDIAFSAFEIERFTSFQSIRLLIEQKIVKN
jgi:acyl carrier protein